MHAGRFVPVLVLIIAAASPAAWSVTPAYTPVNISNNAGYSILPSIGLNGTTLLVVWRDHTPGNEEIYLARSLDTGATWSVPINVSNTAGDSQEYDWAFAGRYVYVAWKDLTAGSGDIYFRRSTTGGASFVSTVNLSMNAGASTAPHVALSGGRDVYVQWVDATPGSDQVFFRRSNDGGTTFFPLVNLSNMAVYAAGLAAFGPHVYVYWKSDDVWVRHSSDGGITFGAAVKVTTTANTGYGARMLVGGPTVDVMYVDFTPGNADVLYKKSTDGGATFGGAANISNNAGASILNRIQRSGTFVHLLWMDYTPGKEDVFYRRSTDGGLTWKAAINLSNNAGSSDPLTRGQMALAGTSLHIVWEDDPSDSGSSNIAYRRSTNSGSTFAAAVPLTSSNAAHAPQVLAVGRDAYVVYHDDSVGGGDIFFLRTATGGFALPASNGGEAGIAGTPNPAVPDGCTQRGDVRSVSPAPCPRPPK
ncbi:MAG TPA: sialidase family protein [bacterium]|jgi:hypothetical protein